MGYLKKLGFISWGGRGVSTDTPGVQLEAGYSNLLGILPVPLVGVRVGGRDSIGVSAGVPYIGISGGRKKSFRDRPKFKGISDVILEAIEDRGIKKQAFESAKQVRYMFAKHPRIAKKMAKDHEKRNGKGSMKDLPEKDNNGVRDN